MSDILEITVLSLQVSTIATLISLLIGLPFGTWLALGDFRGRSFILSVVNTGMALPPVVVGLGGGNDPLAQRSAWRLEVDLHPLGDHHRTDGHLRAGGDGSHRSGAGGIGPRLQQQLLGLGASQPQMIWMLWREARLPLLAALMADFGSVISEVGASMMVGGNIRGQTRVLTTAIVLETSKGEFERALALSALLLVITYLINLALTWIQQKGHKR